MSGKAQLTIIGASDKAFAATLTQLQARGQSDLDRVEASVREIIAAVRSRGDEALLDYVQRFEGRTPSPLLVTEYGGKAALESLEPALREALEEAARRITDYHERQKQQLQGFEYEHEDIRLGSRIQPIERAGVYAPGGKARYPSTVLMTALPARIAGVKHITLACPQTSPEVLAAAHLSGVRAILDAGGAQAIAALAYGTESVPKVDKIVGPGNLFVAAAKRLVFGQVGIDSIAGPSEILVLADESADPEIVAADLLSQAEHDAAAYALLITTSAELATQTQQAVDQQLASLPRRDIASASLRAHGVALVCRDHEHLVQIANLLAAEHVAVHTQDPNAIAAKIRHAGALFIGSSTPEAAGDYLAGPSHVLPTGGAARFSAPLGVYDFVSRTSLISYSPSAIARQAPKIATFARSEGLEAHARAAELRAKRSDS